MKSHPGFSNLPSLNYQIIKNKKGKKCKVVKLFTFINNIIKKKSNMCNLQKKKKNYTYFIIKYY